MKTSKSSKVLGMVLGVIYIVVAIVTFFDPWSDLKNIILLFGGTAVLKGIFELFVRNKLRGYDGFMSKITLVVGLFDIVIGIILLFSLTDSFLALPVVFAIWFIVDSLAGLVLAGTLKEVSQLSYILVMIVCVIGMVIGFMLIFNPMLSAASFSYFLGTYLLINGIGELGSLK